MKLNKEKSQKFEGVISSRNFKKAALVGLLLLTLLASGCATTDPDTEVIASRDLPPIVIETPAPTPTPIPEVDYKIYGPGEHEVFTCLEYVTPEYGELREYNKIEVPEGYERGTTIFAPSEKLGAIIAIETFKNTVEVKVEAKYFSGYYDAGRYTDNEVVYDSFGTPTGAIANETTGPVLEKSADLSKIG